MDDHGRREGRSTMSASGSTEARRPTPWALIVPTGLAVGAIAVVVVLLTSGQPHPVASAPMPLASSPATVSPAPRAPVTPSSGSTLPSAATTAPPTAVPLAPFDGEAALKHVIALAGIGVRKGGTVNEHKGADYIAGQLRQWGYEPVIQTFKLPNGTTSRNVVARAKGESGRALVLGAHMDSKKPSPGANDNASGCGALLEIARDISARRLYASVDFVFFGTEEMVDANRAHHHYGSRYYVRSLSSSERAAISGMVSVDMIGTGSRFVSRTMGTGPQGLSNLLVRMAKKRGMPASYLKDPSAAGWSDHEAFERVGIPVSWIEWQTDPLYHTAKDTAGHVRSVRLKSTGQLVLDFVAGATETTLSGLRR
jgi:aminopeptidase YwaD